MTPRLTVLQPGLGVGIQDLGRRGYAHLGVPAGGALDPWLQQAANALVGNPPQAATLELRASGPTLQALEGPVRLALCGAVRATLQRADGSRVPLVPWRSLQLDAGDQLQVQHVLQGVAYLAFAGGLDLPLQLGSRALYDKARLGGLGGRGLQPGDTLVCGTSVATGPLWQATLAWPFVNAPAVQALRVLAGPQAHHFDAPAWQLFTDSHWLPSPQRDRMGMRLMGPTLQHNQRGADILSDAVCPGAIQVPANGQPIVLLADAQTTGGYPKIATVILADRWRLAHLGPHQALQFVASDHAAARTALTESQALWQRWLAGLQPCRGDGDWDATRLGVDNLVSGMVRGDETGSTD